MNGHWLWVLLAMLALGLLAIGGLACSSATFSPLAHKWDEVYDGRFTADAVKLDLSTGNGSIACHTWNDPGYKLIVHVQSLGATAAQARRRAAGSMTVQQGGDSIRVAGEAGWFPKAVVSIELYLPAGPAYQLQANTGNGAVKLEGGSYAGARVHTGNGEFRSTAAITDLEATTGNGSIRTAVTGSGNWVLATGNGLISVDTADAGETGILVDANTNLGKIVMDIDGHHMEQQGGQGHAPLRLSSDGYAQAHRQLSIQARTRLGKITVLPGA